MALERNGRLYAGLTRRYVSPSVLRCRRICSWSLTLSALLGALWRRNYARFIRSSTSRVVSLVRGLSRSIRALIARASQSHRYGNYISLYPTSRYIHRFGPGLVVYWFGHAPPDLLDDAKGDLAICGWALPNEFMLPDGRIIYQLQP